jgi:hypothetical protein
MRRDVKSMARCVWAKLKALNNYAQGEKVQLNICAFDQPLQAGLSHVLYQRSPLPLCKQRNLHIASQHGQCAILRAMHLSFVEIWNKRRTHLIVPRLHLISARV